LARRRFGFLGWFRDILISGEVGVIKPDPRIFELALSRFAIDPARAVYIDDVAANAEPHGSWTSMPSIIPIRRRCAPSSRNCRCYESPDLTPRRRLPPRRSLRRLPSRRSRLNTKIKTIF